MSETARKPATWEDLLATPDDGRVWEIIDGQLEAQPRPLPRHGRAQGQLYSILRGPFDPGSGAGSWWLIIEPDVQLGERGFVAPDLAGWRRERVPDFPESRPITVVPDWVCEVVSPKDRGRDRVRKAELYLRSGVPHFWLLDLDERTLEAFQERGGSWVRRGAWTDGDSARVSPFEAIEIDVASSLPPFK